MFWLSDTVDGGDIATQHWCMVWPGETASSLWRRELFPMGIQLLKETLEDIAAGRVVRVPQDTELAT